MASEIKCKKKEKEGPGKCAKLITGKADKARLDNPDECNYRSPRAGKKDGSAGDESEGFFLCCKDSLEEDRLVRIFLFSYLFKSSFP